MTADSAQWAYEHGGEARRSLPGEGTGMSGVEELAEQLEVAVKALEHIAESAKHPSPTVNTSDYLGYAAERALAALRGTE